MLVAIQPQCDDVPIFMIESDADHRLKIILEHDRVYQERPLD